MSHQLLASPNYQQPNTCLPKPTLEPDGQSATSPRETSFQIMGGAEFERAQISSCINSSAVMPVLLQPYLGLTPLHKFPIAS